MRQYDVDPGVSLPMPGPALRTVMGVLAVSWLGFALLMNWAPASVSVPTSWLFEQLAGDAAAIAQGQLWRLLTAALLHSHLGLGHIFFALLGLFFLTPALEQTWGAARLLRFLLAAALVSYGMQTAVLLLVPPFVAMRLAPGLYFGSFPVLEAIAIAWALSFQGRTVRLFFVLPVSARGLVLFVVIASVLAIVALERNQSGLVSPFGGMLTGWLLSGNPTPLRRWWLRRRLAVHERELARLETVKRRRIVGSGLRVIEGGRRERNDDDPESGPPSGRILH